MLMWAFPGCRYVRTVSGGCMMPNGGPVMKLSFCLLLLFACVTLESGAGEKPGAPAVGTSGMVSSAHPLASEAGIRILKSGGNAFDAAVAVAAVLNVVEPEMSGMGGYGTIVIYDAKKRETRFLNPSGRIPRAVNSDVYRSPTPGFEENRRGAKAVSTPGNVHAWEQLSKVYGKIPWSKLFRPAIELAESGFPVSPELQKMIVDAFPSFPEWAKRDYGPAGKPLKAGDRLVQKDLARSLRLVAAGGAGAFYRGEIARAIDAAMRERGGFLSIQDLELDQAEWWPTIQVSYRGYQVVTASPPANAFDCLVRLGIMSQFDVASLGHNTVSFLHRFAEATKQGFWVRLRYAGDPEINPPPLQRLLSDSYWKDEAGKIDPNRAKPFVPPDVFGDAQRHTTHFVVADRWGNVVSATQTLGNAFGARIMPRGTGIWLNNSLAYSTFEPKGNPMDAHAGRRKLSGDCPTIILREGRPWVAIGTPGGHTIGQTVPQMVMNLIDFKMDISQAITAPRISFYEPDVLGVEEGIPVSVREQLSRMGHNLRIVPGIGKAHGLTIEYDSAHNPVRFTGASDPRGSGKAIGY
jgi:gamma-glutamyltranspeptidase / glutathione hydrolase